MSWCFKKIVHNTTFEGYVVSNYREKKMGSVKIILVMKALVCVWRGMIHSSLRWLIHYKGNLMFLMCKRLVTLLITFLVFLLECKLSFLSTLSLVLFSLLEFLIVLFLSWGSSSLLNSKNFLILVVFVWVHVLEKFCFNRVKRICEKITRGVDLRIISFLL